MESRTGDFADVVAFVGEFSHDPLGFVYAAFPWGAAGTTLDGVAGTCMLSIPAATAPLMSV